MGPGDETDRFNYWPVRINQGGNVLVPPAGDPVQFIDARDLAEWTIRMAESRTTGEFNGHGPASELTMGKMLNDIRLTVANPASPAVFIEASAKFLSNNKINMWSDMPVWVPGDGETGGFHRRRNAKSINAGLTFRAVGVTAKDTLAWWQTLPEARRKAMRAGIKAAREVDVLKLKQIG
ncbi:MAG: hypothetical protein HC782_00235 [Gammaproteobacteria bacterium]|nr:hypothetical protein [Gammaproteobacteria bacterium]